MRRIYYICWLSLLFFTCGCSKPGNGPVNNSYAITGLADVYVTQYNDTSFIAVYHVVHPADLPEPVTFNMEDLPPGITATPRIVTDTTSFSVQVSYHMLMNAAASFPVTITLYAASIGKKAFTFNVHVAAAPAFVYSLITPPDIQVPLYTDTIIRLPVTATLISGIPEPVTISADELPAGVTATPLSVAGTPSFTDTIAMHVRANAQGSFPVVLHGHSSYGASSANFNINIQPAENCAPPLADLYTGTTVCASYSGVGTGVSPTFVTATGTNRLIMHLPFADATAEVNCVSATMNILPVVSGGFIFAGGMATFNANTIVVNYSLSGTINSACTTTLVR